MNLLILGSGGREHALAWKLSQSKKVTKIFIAPGNAGTSLHGTNLDVDPLDFSKVKDAIIENNIGIVIVGPETPLVKGISDFFKDDPYLSNVPLVGPGKSAALLEGSKDFAKAFMIKHNIPTAAYKSFGMSDIDGVKSFLRNLDPPYVIKADGLAAGKGVVIIDDLMEAEQEVLAMLGGKFGEAGKKVVIEQFLKGIELSVFIATDGTNYVLLPEAKDYKRVGAGDTGLNTGGMGAVSPVPFAGKEFMGKVIERIIDPTVNGLRADGITYKGFIFFGLINVNGDPFVIEYNARLGDPETEVIIPRIKSDFYEIIEGIANGDLNERKIEIDKRFVTTVMMVSGGYPGDFAKNKVITGLENVNGSVVFHAGTRQSGQDVLTSGGRVIAVSSWGETIKEALSASYLNAGVIHFQNSYYRTDIGFDLMK